jgi:hypothetical protein
MKPLSPTRNSDEPIRPGAISEQMYDAILGDDLLIALLTSNNPNVFYEVAIAQAAARPLIPMLHHGHKMPFDVHDHRAFYYDLKPRKLMSGEYANRLHAAILELEAAPRPLKVPFRPGLSPLGAGASDMEVFPRSEALPREKLISSVKGAKSYFWLQGIALFSFAKIGGFEEAAKAALARNVEFRILMLDPDNPALEYILRDFSPDYLDLVRREIKAGAAFWRSLNVHGALQVRFQTKGAMLSNSILSDNLCVLTQYCLARSTSESPTIVTDSTSPLYQSCKQDYEWAWARAT